jgi:putative transposase
LRRSRVKKSRFTESQILAILTEGGSGIPMAEVCRKHGIRAPTYYQWKSKCAGMSLPELKWVKELEAENAKLKRMYAELALENTAIKDVLSRKL